MAVLLKESGAAAGRLAELIGRAAGRRPVARRAEHAGAGLGGRRRRRAGPGRARRCRSRWRRWSSRRRRRCRCAAGRPGDGAQPRRHAGVAHGLRHRRAGARRCRPRATRCGSAGASSTSTAAAGPRPAEAEHACSCCCWRAARRTGRTHHALVLQGLPAGWEIAGRLAAGEVAGDALAGRAERDRGAARRRRPLRRGGGPDPATPDFRVAVRLRAVTPGQFELPGAESADMYRPAVFARQNGGRVVVLGAGEPAPAGAAAPR